MNSVTLIIRCAHQANEDLKIDVAKSDWTVRQLKLYLCDVHPSKPAPERQRVVFAGQLLRDDARLADYFSRYDQTEPFVLHLVYTASIEENVAAAEHRAKKENELRKRTPFTPSDSGTSVGQRLDSVPTFSTSSASSYAPQYWPWTSQQVQLGPTPDVASDWIRQQQQMYAAMNAMMSQWYGQYMQAAYGASVGFYPSSPFQQPAAFDFGAAGQQQHQLEPIGQQPDAQLAQGPPQQVMNAQGGMAPADIDEDDVRNRDWLDYLYMGCRASLLMTILYFYSSLERLVFVMLCCTLMYGLQAGWFGRRGGQQDEQERRANGPGVAQEAGPAPQRNELEAQRPDGAAVEQDQPVHEALGPDVAGRRAPTQDAPMTAWNVFWTTCWTFISSFFASLVPERPPPLNM